MFLQQAFFNGQFLPLKNIQISPTDLGIQRGYSIFDFFKLKNGENPWFEWYMDRLELSASLVNLNLPYSREEIKDICVKVLSTNAEHSGYTKVIISAGGSIDGYTRHTAPSILILGLPIKKPSIEYYTKGAKLLLYEYTRDLPRVKSTNYIVSAMLAPEMKAQNTIDVLYHNGTHISECSRCSFFIVKKNLVITSKTNILNGITRQRLLSADSSDYEIIIRDIALSDINNIDEAFITSTSKGVMPIVQIGGQVIGSGKVGPITMKCMNQITKF